MHLQQGADFYAYLRTQAPLEKAQVAVVVIDVSEPVREQDMRVVDLVVKSGRGLVIAFNRWDLLDDERRRYLEREIEVGLDHVEWAPRVNISAETGRHIDKLPHALHTAWDSWDRRIGTGELNAFVAELAQAHLHPVRGGKQPRVLYTTQASTRPPLLCCLPTVFSTRSIAGSSNAGCARATASRAHRFAFKCGFASAEASEKRARQCRTRHHRCHPSTCAIQAMPVSKAPTGPVTGVVLVRRAPWSGIPHRACCCSFALGGATTAAPGGFLAGGFKKGESAHHAALREAGEEAGVPEQGLETLHKVSDLGFWSYTTVLLYARNYFKPEVTDRESVDVQWVPLDTVSSLDLHPGFEKSWPGLLAQIQPHTGSILSAITTTVTRLHVPTSGTRGVHRVYDCALKRMRRNGQAISLPKCMAWCAFDE